MLRHGGVLGVENRTFRRVAVSGDPAPRLEAQLLARLRELSLALPEVDTADEALARVVARIAVEDPRRALRVWAAGEGLDGIRLAEALGFSRATVSYVLSGQRLPGTELEEKIEELAGIPRASWHSKK